MRVQWSRPCGYPSEMSWVSTGPDIQYEGVVVGFVPAPKAIVHVDDFLVEVGIEDLKVMPELLTEEA